ncbi:uncharacterized protein PHALS_06651 [Plasmopara halstedii]|uniref:Uncharacterized protein n=1 Tax=Plasmopara halstedii TaxID=4781 RepID=A0A0P1B4K0_PLAHL|nr:uncharacterized protein PHALS_06651 [Plasmopara halstedii]CEG48854.1 hypothetical protein PHALS_06651 [Plasmopara halstedii]|eukprot:XP_024585223.1 hypothetical protein PHALS_06651 [Plasmopara halstedii]
MSCMYAPEALLLSRALHHQPSRLGRPFGGIAQFCPVGYFISLRFDIFSTKDLSIASEWELDSLYLSTETEGHTGSNV